MANPPNSTDPAKVSYQRDDGTGAIFPAPFVGGAGASRANGQIILQPLDAGMRANVTWSGSYNFTDDWFAIDSAAFPSRLAGFNAHIWVQLGPSLSNNVLEWYLTGDVLEAGYTVNGSITTGASTTFNPTQHRYWRITNFAGDALRWEVSPDGETWTTLHEMSTRPVALTACQFRAEVQVYQSPFEPWIINGINALPRGVEIITGTVAMTTQAEMTSAGLVVSHGDVSLPVASSVASTGHAETVGAATTEAVADLVSVGHILSSGQAAVTATPQLAADGRVTTAGALSVAASARLAATGQAITSSAADLAVLARLGIDGQAITAGAVELGAVPRLVSDGSAITTGAAALAVTALLTADGEVISVEPGVVLGSVGFAAAANLPSAGLVETAGRGAMPATATLAADGRAITSGSVAGTIRSQVAADGLAVTDGRTRLETVALLTADGAVIPVTGVVIGSVAFDAGARLAADGQVRVLGRADLATSAVVAADGLVIIDGEVELAAQAILRIGQEVLRRYLRAHHGTIVYPAQDGALTIWRDVRGHLDWRDR